MKKFTSISKTDLKNDPRDAYSSIPYLNESSISFTMSTHRLVICRWICFKTDDGDDDEKIDPDTFQKLPDLSFPDSISMISPLADTISINL